MSNTDERVKVVDKWVDSKNWEAFFSPRTREEVRKELTDIVTTLLAEREAEGRAEERARIVEWLKKLKGTWRPYDTMINVLVEHLTTQSEDTQKLL